MSSFLLSPEHEELRSALRRFAEEGIAPNAAAADAEGEYPRASFEAYRASGFVRLPYPEEYGGDGGDMVAYAMLVEEVARVCGSSSLFVMIPRLAIEAIILFGSDELKARIVPKVAAGEWQGSYCLSESNAGSDVASMRTRAIRDGDSFVLTGSKSWITNAGVSDFYTVFAKTDPGAGHRGISVFVVEADRPGFSVAKLESKMGMRGSPTGEIRLDDVRVPAANLIGEENRGFGYAMAALDGSRPIVGAQAVGIAQGALDAAARYVTERHQFDQPVAEFQGVQFMLADMATRVEAARLLVYSVCVWLDAGMPGTSKASAMAKLFASDTAMSVTTDAVQLFGGAGYTKDFPVERMMRDAKVTQIYEGTNQIQRVVIGRRLLDEVVAARVSVDVRAAFLRSATSARAVIAVPEVAARWDEPSVLPRFTVRGLTGHLGRCAWVVEQYLDAGIPADAVDVGDAAGYYAAAALGPDLDDALNTSIRTRGEAEAADGRDAVLARLDASVARLGDLLASLPGDARIAAVAGVTLDLDEYLVTRLVELVVHADDLAVSVGVEPPAPDPDAATLVIECLVEVARRRHGDLAVVLGLTRRDRDPDAVLRVF